MNKIIQAELAVRLMMNLRLLIEGPISYYKSDLKVWCN